MIEERPFNKRELQRKAKLIISMEGNSTSIKNPENSKMIKTFTYDYSYWSHDGFVNNNDKVAIPDSPDSRYICQQKLFDDLGKTLLENAFDGYSCSLFAYGQTGSGKSYSMIGYGPNRGIIPIICKELFKVINSTTTVEKNFQVTIGMLEIYNEKIIDLLAEKNKSEHILNLRQSAKKGFDVQGQKHIPVGSYEDIEQQMNHGTAKRTVATTNMNATSSRGHTIVILTVSQFIGNKESPTSLKRSVIKLVDLAGSERSNIAKTTGDRLKEGANINRSLFILGNVISALVENKKSVPYRESVLTKIMQNALGGNSKTVMLAAISPADINYEETLSTLNYANRAKQIKNKAVVNEHCLENLINELKEENKRLRMALNEIDLPATVETKGLSAEEIKKMKENLRKELMEEMNLNMEEIEAQNYSIYEKKLNLAREEIKKQALNIAKVDQNRDQPYAKPYLSNLNQDPQLCNVIVYVLEHKRHGIGCNPSNYVESLDQKHKHIHWITMKGLSIADEHAIFTRKDNEVKLSATASARQLTKVNGKPLNKSIMLKHKDRILFGSHQLYLFLNPLSTEVSTESESIDEDELPDWEFAQRELVQATYEISEFASTPKNKEDIILQQNVFELLPMIMETNTIAEEMDKNRIFKVILIPPTAQSLKFGEAKETKLIVQMEDSKTGHIWFWEREKYMSRRFIMQDMYQKYLSKELEDLSKESDPFWDPLEDVFVGVAPAFLRALAHRLDVNEDLKILNFGGDNIGFMKVELVACSKTGRHLDNIVQDPLKLIGEPYYFKVIINSVDILSQVNNCSTTKIYYRIFKEDDLTEVVINNGSTPPVHERVCAIDNFTQEHLDYFNKEPICFLVYFSQENKKNNYKILKCCEEIRRCSRINISEINDVSRIKTDFVLLQQKLNRFMDKNKQLEILHCIWIDKQPNKENYNLLLQEIDKIIKT